jgi:hypothetical protein
MATTAFDVHLPIMIWLLVLALGALGGPVSGAEVTPFFGATTLTGASAVPSSPTVPSFLGTEPPTESRGENVRRDPPFRDPTKTSGGRAAGSEPLGPKSGSLAHQVGPMMKDDESHNNLTETPSRTAATPSAATLLERKLVWAPNSSEDVAGSLVCNISLQCPACTSPFTENLGDFYKTDLVANTQPVYAHETQKEARSCIARREEAGM